MQDFVSAAVHDRAAARDVATLPLGPRVHSLDQLRNTNFDRFILGSDEIWNLNNPIMGGDLAYFGVAFESARVRTYAPSFGSVSTPAQLSQSMRDALRKIHFLSGRDTNTISILQSLGLSSSMVLDPTMLGDLAPATQVVDGKQIVLYGYRFSDDLLNGLKAYAATKGNFPVSVIYPQGRGIPHLANVNAQRFLELMRRSAGVVTTTFHGVIMAVLAHKPFAVLNPGEKQIKVGELLRLLGEQDRESAYLADFKEQLSRPLNTQRLAQLIGDLTKKSVKYLNDTLA